MDEQKIECSENYKISLDGLGTGKHNVWLGSEDAGRIIGMALCPTEEFIMGVDLAQEPTYWTGPHITKKENPLISRLKEILRYENYIFEKMEHKSAIYVSEKDNILSFSEKYAEITALVEYEKRKVKVKMLKELINHLENVERRERDEKSAESYTHREKIDG